MRSIVYYMRRVIGVDCGTTTYKSFIKPTIHTLQKMKQDLKNEDTPENATLWKKYTRIMGVVALYWTISISLVFLNKYLLKSDSLKLDAPLFVTFYQCVITVLLCLVCSAVSQKKPNLLTFPSTQFDMKLSREVLPLSIVFVGMITFNNLCLRSVGVAFYTIARSLVTIFSLIFTYFILGKKTSLPALATCAVIISGFCLGVNQEGEVGSLSVLGTVYGVIASSLVALNAIYIKKILPVVDEDIWKLTYYNNINACAIFLPMIIIFGELKTLFEFENLSSMSFWFFMTLSGFFGFIMGFVVGLEVKVTTPVTHNISGVAKACLQTVIAVVYHGQTKTALWWMSNLLVLTGTGAYSGVKSWEMKVAHEEAEKAKLAKEFEEKKTSDV
ncbi:GDP-fucose transporter 1-like [Styela clava]|uniref:GDP-fucose transporter 1-like n=1 Tax=Styela clava TaxID=7725 RepID=UPI00193A29DB|nr:GDP-fucose transporter 1-like [Styela clava]